MKLIYVIGNNENDASIFANEFGEKLDIKLWNQIKEDGYLVIEDEGGDIDIEVKSLEFGDVDPNFIGFVRSVLIDPEMTPHSNIFIIKE